MKKILSLLGACLLMYACDSREHADVLFYNGPIYTVNDSFAKVNAMAIKDGKVLAVGDQKQLLEQYNAEESVDLDGRSILPGFIDAHCHFTGYALNKGRLDIKGHKSWNETLDSLKQYAARTKAKWILGRGWDQNLWASKNFPNKQKLDELFPDRPVYLVRVDGHAAIANAKALELAGVDMSSKVEGGLVEKIEGQLTGILIDNAMELVSSKIPQVADDIAEAFIKEVQQECFSYGLTSVHDCGLSSNQLELLKRLDEKGVLKMNIYALLSDNPENYDKYLAGGRQQWGRIHLGGFKVFMDGALGSRGAALIEPYSDKAGWSGFLLKEYDKFKATAEKIATTNMQMCTHAIGDFANRSILEIYAAVLKGNNPNRWRVEHAQVVHPDDLHYFKDNQIIPSVQPTHATSDMEWAVHRLGKERSKTAYAYKDLMNTIGWIALGTDFPIEGINPMNTFVSATTRQNEHFAPKKGFQMENALDRPSTLKGMTIWAAKSGFEEEQRGSLEVGKQADFVILNKDMMIEHYKRLNEIKVQATWVAGECVFSLDDK